MARNQILIAMSLIASPLLMAQDECSTIGRTPFRIYFGNGINTTLEGADDALGDLKALVLRALPSSVDPSLISFCVSYDETYYKLNPDNTFSRVPNIYAQLFDAAGQATLDTVLSWIDNFQLAPVPIQSLLINAFNSANYTFRPNLQQHVNEYATQLASGKVIVVAHSQGNFYANEAYNLLSTDPTHFSVIAVATPSDRVAGFSPGLGPWTTLHNDVITRITFLPGLAPLTPNWDNNPPCSVFNQIACHDFLKSYLYGGHPISTTQISGNTSGPRIIGQVISAIGVQPPNCVPTFVDTFNRPDGPVGNGWVNTVGNTNGDIVIRNGALVGTSDRAAIYRPIDFSKPVTVSATLNQENGFGGSGRYGGFLFGNNGSVLNGYGVFFGRYPQNTGNLTVQLILNGTVGLANDIAPAGSFQFGPSITPTVTFGADGSITGTVTGNGTTFNFNLGVVSRALLPGANLAIYSQGFSDGGSNPTIDNVTVASCGTPAPISFYTSRSAWTAAVPGATTINFENIALSASVSFFDTSAGLFLSGVRFVGTAPSNSTLPFYLRVVNAASGDVFYNWNSGAILHGPPIPIGPQGEGGPNSHITATLPFGTTAVAVDIMSILDYASSFSIVISTADGPKKYSFASQTYPNRTFVGVKAISQITSIEFYANTGFPIIDNFSFGH